MTKRQGDLSFHPVAEMPKGKQVKSFILAFGETSGHKHQLVAEKGATLTVAERVEDSISKIYFKVEGGKATLVHEEHNTITFSPGEIYVTIPEREFDYFTKSIQLVQD